jgi:hypothetical protein
MTTSWTHFGTEVAHDGSTAWTPESVAVSGTVAAGKRDEVVELLKNEMRALHVSLQALRTTLDEGGLPPELADRMRRHTKSLARRLALLLEDLVLVITWGPRRLALDLQDLNLADHVARAADLFPDMLIHIKAAPDVLVRADALRLQQLLANLIHSAQRSGERPVCLYVTCLDTLVTLRMLGAPPEGGYELDIVRHIVDPHGGRLRHHPAEGAVTVTLRRVLPART